MHDHIWSYEKRKWQFLQEWKENRVLCSSLCLRIVHDHTTPNSSALFHGSNCVCSAAFFKQETLDFHFPPKGHVSLPKQQHAWHAWYAMWKWVPLKPRGSGHRFEVSFQGKWKCKVQPAEMHLHGISGDFSSKTTRAPRGFRALWKGCWSGTQGKEMPHYLTSIDPERWTLGEGASSTKQEFWSSIFIAPWRLVIPTSLGLTYPLQAKHMWISCSQC